MSCHIPSNTFSKTACSRIRRSAMEQRFHQGQSQVRAPMLLRINSTQTDMIENVLAINKRLLTPIILMFLSFGSAKVAIRPVIANIKQISILRPIKIKKAVSSDAIKLSAATRSKSSSQVVWRKY